MSYQIMNLYEDTASSVNEGGKTPLHILASTPSAFPSGTPALWWEKLFYKFIPIEKLKIEPPEAYKVVDVVEPSSSKTAHIHAPVKSLKRILVSFRRKKERHVWGGQIMKKLVEGTEEGLDKLIDFLKDNVDDHKYGLIEFMKRDAKRLMLDRDRGSQNETKEEPSTPLLTAVKYGLSELVDKILQDRPLAICDIDYEDKKNIVLVAVEHRQSRILTKVMRHPLWNDEMKYAVDIHGNNALHLVAKLSERTTWEIPMSPMHMQWEVKWFKWVKEMMPPHFSYARTYKDNKTPTMIFEEEHRGMDSNQWLKDSSVSYTVASTLITSVTFGTSVQFPGGSDERTGDPKLVGDPAFDAFTMATLVAFTFSMTALAAFLAVYGSASQSHKQPSRYHRYTPFMLLTGIASLFVSMLATLVAFYAAHFHEVDRRKFRMMSPVLYVVTLLPSCFCIVTQIPLFWHILKDALLPVPHPAGIAEDKDAHM